MKRTTQCLLLFIIMGLMLTSCGVDKNASNNTSLDSVESYCYTTVYTFGKLEVGAANVIDSKEELENCCGSYEKISKNERYNEKWFEGHQLIVIPLVLNSKTQPSVSSVSVKPEKQIVIDIKTPEGFLPENVNNWYVVIETGKLYSKTDQIIITQNEIMVKQ